MRITHEAKMNENNKFVTITYNDESLPKNGMLQPQELTLFLKRIHNDLLRKRGKGIRYYACGEYGEERHRPHYHACIFDLPLNDLKYYKTTAIGETLFTSKYLERMWPHGFNTVGALTFESAAYTARYVTKKWNEETLEMYGYIQPFARMSRRPGIGATWFEKYGDHAYKFDSVILREKEMQPPKYYDNRLEALDPSRYSRLKQRRNRSKNHKRNIKNNTPRQRMIRDTVTRAKIALKKREPK